MKKISYEDVQQFISPSNIVSSGKEVTVYFFGEQVIKIFHSERKLHLKSSRNF